MQSNQENERITELMVMRSNAGWYVGRGLIQKIGPEQYTTLPYSRESGYFSSKKKAEEELSFLQYCEELENE